MVRLGACGMVFVWRGRSYRKRIAPELWSAAATFCSSQDGEWHLPGERESTGCPEGHGPFLPGLPLRGSTPPG